MRKRQQRVFAVIIVGLVTLAMVGSGFAMFFSNSGIPSPNQNSSTNTNTIADYQAKKASLATLAAQAKSDTGNIALQTALGNQYYDAGLEAETVAPSESPENYKHAVEAYQNVLKVNKDTNVMVDMATAAFKSGQNDLAEKMYQEALTIKPDFLNGLVNYGIFLANIKQDLPGAIAQWQKAQNAATTSTDKDQINSLISQAQNQLKSGTNPATGGANPSNGGYSNPNPALKNGASNPAPTGK